MKLFTQIVLVPTSLVVPILLGLLLTVHLVGGIGAILFRKRKRRQQTRNLRHDDPEQRGMLPPVPQQQQREADEEEEQDGGPNPQNGQGGANVLPPDDGPDEQRDDNVNIRTYAEEQVGLDGQHSGAYARYARLRSTW